MKWIIRWVVIGLLWGSCWGAPASRTSIRVGVYDYAPFNFMDGSVARGVSVDLLREVSRIGKQWDVTFVEVAWADGGDLLETEEIDLMMSVVKKSTHEQTMDYTQSPIIEMWGQVYVPLDQTVNKIADLKNKRVAVIDQDLCGKTFINRVRKLSIPCEIIPYAHRWDVFDAIRSGEVDAGVAPNHFGNRQSMRVGLKQSPVRLSPVTLFFATKKGRHQDCLSAIDAQLNDWRLSEDSFYFDRLDYWFNGERIWVKNVPFWGWVIIASIGVLGLLLLVFNRILNYRVIQQTVALRDLSARQLSLLGAIPDIVVEVDRQRRIVWTNSAGYEFYGSDVIGKAVDFYIEGRKAMPCCVENLMKGEHTQENLYVENVQRRQDGQKRCLAWWCRALVNEKGQVTGALSTARDVTESKQLAAALSTSEERYELAERAVNDGLWDCDLLTDELYCSTRWREILGYSEEDLPHLFSDLYRFIYPLDQGVVAEAFRAHFEEHQRYEVEFRMRHRDGSYRWVLARGEASRDSSGNPVRMVGSITDVSERKRTQSALRESIAKYQELAENTDSILWEYDIAQDTWTYVAPQVERLLGYAPDEWVNMASWASRLHPEDWCVSLDQRDWVTRSMSGHFEYRFRKKNGEFIWLRNVVNVKRRDGVPIALRGVMFDITQLKKTLFRLTESQGRFKAIYDHAPLCFQSLDEAGRFVDVNPMWLKTLGYQREEVLGQPFIEFISEEERAGFLDKFAAFKQLGYVNGAQFQIRHKEGRYLVVEFEGRMGRSSDSHAYQTYCVFKDITESKRAEAEKERLMTAINQAAETVMITDASGIIEYVNPAFETITGYSSEEAIGKNPRFLQSGRHKVDFYTEMWATLLRGDAWSGRFYNQKKNGTFYTEDATISPVKDMQGEIVNYVAVKHDVTDEMKLEDELRQSQKMQSIGQLVGGVAHDFNNLLQVINGYVEMVRKQLVKNRLSVTSIDEISKAGARAKDLVQQLLVFGRQQVIDPTELDLNEEIASSQKMIGRLIGEHIELHFIPGEDVGLVFADRGQISQVLMNLCVNSRDAMPDGGQLTIKTESLNIAPEDLKAHVLTRPGRYALLSVEDTGCGMEKLISDKVFDPFFTTKAMGKGTGLGLSTVYGIVKQNEGHIAIYSEPGQGTVINVYLPVCTPLPTRVFPESVEPVESVECGVETLLVVEDEESLLSLATCLLSEAGYTVLTATNGEEAVRVFEEHVDEVDLVMMDVVMPRMGGKEAMQKILERRSSLRYLFVSGYSPDAGHTDFIKEKGLHLLNKPYQSASLLRKIREVLDE